jgi:anti-sigma B factor antagonist
MVPQAQQEPLNPRPFEVTVEHRGSTLIAVLVGELDLASEGLLREALASGDQGWSELLIDLRQLDFMDSCGIKLLLEQRAVVLGAGREFGVVLGDGPARRVFDLVGLTGEMVRDAPAP